MIESGRIDGRQAVYLVITYIVATALLGVPVFATKYASQDAWMSILVSTLVSFFLGWITVKLSSHYPGKTLTEFMEEMLSPWLGKIVGFFYIFFFVHIGAVMVREFGDFLSEAFMPNTPILVFHIIIVFLAAITIKQGLEVLARANQVFLPLVLLSIIIILLLAIQESEIKRLLPLFESGPVKIFKGALAPMAWQGEIIAFAWIIPFLAGPKNAGGVVFKALVAVGIIFMAIVLVSLATFGPNMVPSMSYPLLNIARLIHVGQTIERMEPLIMVAWVAGGFVKITFFYYVVVLSSAQLVALKDYRLLVWPFGVILISLSVSLAENALSVAHFIGNVFPFYGLLLFEGGIPLALLILTWIRGTKRLPEGKK